ncbi:chromosomal replication initiator protein DnaA [Demequina sp. SYSU T00b26]|uniref:Chromosomal replication initiator protein DnaA n=1 Tax=Demequina zhanjiangensis TaxID=3051659 RepID=A0ABT8G459_9MICO|nr:chromosomal replication initiator protein DnaA [Demequina sp. SYSU T00b26]MDN4473883.1 chromosomal replication initiator protein DnaA [Demequina sp. SYSU T00b26]
MEDIWREALEHLVHDSGISAQHRSFLRLVKPLAVVEDNVFLAVAEDFTKTYIESTLRGGVTEALSHVLGRDIRIAVTVDASVTPPDIAVPEPTAVDDAGTSAPSAPTPVTRTPDAVPDPHLNPRYTFDTFVIGSSNRFAHAAALAVAESPGKTYNPLFIYGGSGLGKTHLLHAIGHYTRQIKPQTRVRYVNSEEFTNDFINSIRDDRSLTFKRTYREVDVLLIDDIQFLQGKEQTLEEFFHTFNALHNAGKHVVITSDVSPRNLDGIEERMRTRFEWGLMTDVQPPDLETRIAILRKKAQADDVAAPGDVLEYIASNITSNIRELEGALIRVTAFAALNKQTVDLSLAQVVLKDLISDNDSEITASSIIGTTADYFGISMDELTGTSRSRVFVTARQIAMYLCRELTDLSLPKIGEHFGGKDHTTVMYSVKKVEDQIAQRRQMYNQVNEIHARVKQQTRG